MRVSKKVRAAIEKVVGYNWSDEIEDYVENCGNVPEFNQRKGHVFESLVVIDNAINGTNYTPEWWVLDYCGTHNLDVSMFGNEATA